MSEAFAATLLAFGRSLRAAGAPAGSGDIALSLAALRAAGVRRRDDVYWTLHAILVKRREHHETFDLAFRLFFDRERIGMDKRQAAEKAEEGRRAILDPGWSGEQEAGEAGGDALAAYSAAEVNRAKDFEAMTEDEMQAAEDAIRAMRFSLAPIPARRYEAAPRGGRIDMRATLKANLRAGGAAIPLRHARRRERAPRIVALCDISGSMSRYARALLQFLHVMTRETGSVATFVFATRLTDVTRLMRAPGRAFALDALSRAAADFSGGTRIGEALRAFNLLWSRRLLGQGAIVLLITDGLDQDAGEGLAAEMERLHLSCRRLIWLNPLLRYEKFEPKSRGVRAMLPHVDEFRAVHNLDALARLSDALAGTGGGDWMALRGGAARRAA